MPRLAIWQTTEAYPITTFSRDVSFLLSSITPCSVYNGGCTRSQEPARGKQRKLTYINKEYHERNGIIVCSMLKYSLGYRYIAKYGLAVIILRSTTRRYRVTYLQSIVIVDFVLL